MIALNHTSKQVKENTMSNTNNNYHSVDRITVTKKTLFDSSQEYVYVTIEAGDELHTINLFNIGNKTLDLQVKEEAA